MVVGAKQGIFPTERSAWRTVRPFAIRSTTWSATVLYMDNSNTHINGLPLTMLWKASCLR